MWKQLLAAGIAVALATGARAADEKAALVVEAKAIMKKFGGALKAELQAAMKKGGPVEAIGVCNTRAPAIAAAVSQGSGWTVARSSHKLRNPKNAADAYTMAAIEDFLAREAKGEKAGKMVKAQIVKTDSGRVFRLVKAIPTAGICTACHGGAEVAPEVVAKLSELYPQDKARGFKPGQMRGVFTLMKKLD